MAGWRIGAIAGAKEYINEILKFKSNMDSGMFKPVQLAGAEALNLEADWVDKVNEIYRKRRTKVWEIMDLLNCNYDKSSIGMFVWGKTDLFCGNEEKLIEEILQKAKVFITPGRIFGKNGKGYIRISLTNSIDKLEKVITRIKK
jgi:aspartate/methionine/tyrosine aminotransferase